MATDRADRAAVCDHEDRPFGMLGGNPLDGADDPLRQLLARLAVVADLPAEPARVPLGESLLDLRAREAGPRADVDLAQTRILDDGEPQPVGDDTSSLARAQQVARVDRGDPVAGEPLGELGRLGSTSVVERGVGVALPAADAVPVGLAVACEEDAASRELG